MADTAVKKYYDEAQRVVDEQAILDKYNAATVAQFNVQREQNRQAENQFYNEMYNTQKTAMDTIRQSNAAAVASGASRGVQAAQELSSLLGLQQESVASATELAQANRQTAQEETAAVLENVLNAYKQATADRQQYVQSAIEAESVEATKAQTAASVKSANDDRLLQARAEGTDAYLAELSKQAAEGGTDYTTYSTEGQARLDDVLNSINTLKKDDLVVGWDSLWGKSNDAASAKVDKIGATLNQTATTFGLNAEDYAEDIKRLKRLIDSASAQDMTKAYNIGKEVDAKSNAMFYRDITIDMYNQMYNSIVSRMRADYIAKNFQTEK